MLQVSQLDTDFVMPVPKKLRQRQSQITGLHHVLEEPELESENGSPDCRDKKLFMMKKQSSEKNEKSSRLQQQDSMRECNIEDDENDHANLQLS